jgi:Divergent InlB B-repeat domain
MGKKRDKNCQRRRTEDSRDRSNLAATHRTAPLPLKRSLPRRRPQTPRAVALPAVVPRAVALPAVPLRAVVGPRPVAPLVVALLAEAQLAEVSPLAEAVVARPRVPEVVEAEVDPSAAVAADEAHVLPRGHRSGAAQAGVIARVTGRTRAFVAGVASLVAAVVTTTGASAEEIPVLTTPAGEFQPARGPSHFAWEQNSKKHPRHYDVLVRPDGGSTFKVNGGRSNGALGGIDENILVYQQFRRGRSDVFFFDLATGDRTRPKLVNSRHWEYWPSISDPWLLYARRMESDARKLFLLNLDTGQRLTLDTTMREGAFIAPGQVNGDYAVWSTCAPRCNVFRYHLPSGNKSMITNPGAYHRAPSVTPDGTVFYARGAKRCGSGERLVRSPLEGPETIVAELPEGLGIGDTYAFAEQNGTVEVYFDRGGCDRLAASDILMVREPALVDLEVTKQGAGSGTVTSDPPGIQCGLDCSEGYEAGSTVRLRATPDPGSAFAGWSGGCAGTGDCAVKVDTPKSVTATFLPLDSVTIVKDSRPDDPQDFDFDHTFFSSLGFTLDDDNDPTLPNSATFANLPSNNYMVEEENPTNPMWVLTDIDCSDPDGGTTVNLLTRRATIDLDEDEVIVCTFTNTKV